MNSDIKTNPSKDSLEEPSDNIPRTKGFRIKAIFFYISVVVIALGNWNDARIMVFSVYSGIIINFTDRLEHEQLSHVRVGSNLKYIESLLGHSRLIRSSAIDESINYRYYLNPKYLLTLAVEEDQVVGYQVASLTNTFRAEVPFTNSQLNTVPLYELQSFPGNFAADNYNATYYLETQNFGREGMFYQLHLGFTEYSDDHRSKDYTLLFSGLMDEMVHGETEVQIEKIAQLRSQVVPNIYTIGKLSLEQASEMLMTRYEIAGLL